MIFVITFTVCILILSIKNINLYELVNLNKLPNACNFNFQSEAASIFSPSRFLYVNIYSPQKLRTYSTFQSCIDEHKFENLNATYLKPLLETLKKTCFQKSPRSPDIFDKVASTLRLSSYKLRTDIATIQKIYISELEDNEKTRILLGRIILHTAHRQMIKSKFPGIPKEVFILTYDILLRNSTLSQMKHIATNYNYSENDWDSKSILEKTNLIYSLIAVHPEISNKILEESINSKGSDINDFILDILKSINLITRGGKRYARKMLSKNHKHQELLKIRNSHNFNKTRSETNHSSFISSIFYSWIKKECGNISNKIKHDINKTIFNYDNIIRCKFSHELDFDFFSSDIWRNSLLINNENDQVRKYKIVEDLLKSLELYTHEDLKAWKILDLLIINAGFNDRQSFLAAISRIKNDKRYGIELKHFATKKA